MAMIHEAIASIMAEVPAITKDRRNQQQGFQYRGIDDVYLAVHPLFAKHGIFSVPNVEDERSEERISKTGGALIYRILRVRYDFYARDGSSISATVIGEGMDSGDKASNKALAVAHKYALLQILCVPTQENLDPDAESPEVAPKTEAPKTSPITEQITALDAQLVEVMTATIGAVPAFDEATKAKVRAMRAGVKKETAHEEDRVYIESIVTEYRGKLENLRALWVADGSPTPWTRKE